MTGRSRAVPAAATAWPRGSRRRLPGRNRRNGRRFLPGGRAVPANRPAGSCPTAGQEPPRSGGSCAGAGQQPPHHSWVLHHPCLCGRFLCQTPSGDIPRGKTPSTLWRYPPFSPMHLLTLIIACTRIPARKSDTQTNGSYFPRCLACWRRRHVEAGV